MIKQSINKWIIALVLTIPAWLIAQSGEPMQLTADEAEQDFAKNVSVFIGHVDITQGVANLKADRVEAKVNAQNHAELFIATGKPAVFTYSGKKEPITATSSRIEYRVTEEKIVLTGSPELKQGLANLKADKIEAILDKNNRAKLLIGTGNPAIFTHKGKEVTTAKANRVEYHVDSGDIIMTGHPEVAQGSKVQKMNAEQITYNLNKEKMKAKRVKIEYLPAN